MRAISPRPAGVSPAQSALQPAENFCVHTAAAYSDQQLSHPGPNGPAPQGGEPSAAVHAHVTDERLPRVARSLTLAPAALRNLGAAFPASSFFSPAVGVNPESQIRTQELLNRFSQNGLLEKMWLRSVAGNIFNFNGYFSRTPLTFPGAEEAGGDPIESKDSVDKDGALSTERRTVLQQKRRAGTLFAWHGTFERYAWDETLQQELDRFPGAAEPSTDEIRAQRDEPMRLCIDSAEPLVVTAADGTIKPEFMNTLWIMANVGAKLTPREIAGSLRNVKADQIQACLEHMARLPEKDLQVPTIDAGGEQLTDKILPSALTASLATSMRASTRAPNTFDDEEFTTPGGTINHANTVPANTARSLIAADAVLTREAMTAVWIVDQTRQDKIPEQ